MRSSNRDTVTRSGEVCRYVSCHVGRVLRVCKGICNWPTGRITLQSSWQSHPTSNSINESNQDTFFMSTIRPKVVCVLWHAERMLLIRATDPHDGRSFLLPPGGGVEFGETIDDAIRRELFEELGIQIENPRRLGMLENVLSSMDGRSTSWFSSTMLRAHSPICMRQRMLRLPRAMARS